MTTTSWRELLAEASNSLGAQEARWVVEEASGRHGPELVSELDSPSTVRGVAALDRMIRRRLDGEPLQYVLGHWGFRTLDLAVDSRVLIPRPETEVVAGVALDELDRLERSGEQLLAVDLGTGSGAIGLSLVAENTGVTVMCTDVSDGALAVARANLAGMGRPATRVTVHQGSWFDALPGSIAGEIDLIVSNPPYIAESEELPPVVADFEPQGALIAGPTGLEAAAVILGGARLWLRPGGSVVLELAPAQLAPAARLAQEQGFGEVEVKVDLAGRDRVLVAR